MKVLALILLGVAGCFAATTIEILSVNPNESELVRLVQLAGLVDALNQGTFTIFAPTNAAFSKIPKDTLASLEQDTQALANILLFHVAQGRIYSRDARDELTIAALNGDRVRFNVYSHNGKVTVNGAHITEFDREGSNGVIHVIDHVMLPPTGDIVDIVSNTPELSTLLSLVSQAGLAGALKGDGLTLFAPTNSAFAKLSSTVTSRLTSDAKLLADVLAYHVVPSTEYSVGLYNRERLQTIDSFNDTVTVSAGSSGVRINLSRVTKADISTKNGVIHEIDNILVPFRYLGQVLVG